MCASCSLGIRGRGRERAASKCATGPLLWSRLRRSVEGESSLAIDPRSLALNKRYRLGQYAPQPVVRKPVVAARPVAGRPVAVRPGVVAPATPNFAALLAELARGPAQRSDEEWDSLLSARTKPFVDAIEGSTLRGRAFNEYNFETKAQANKALSEGFLQHLTGGKPGDDAMAYSKENFGGSYLPAQVFSMAAQQLGSLTSDFDDNDWKITGGYLEAMREVPAIREELRAKLESQDLSAYDRKVTNATLLMDETWRLYQQNRGTFESDRKYGQEEREIKRAKGESLREFKERRRQYNEQMQLAKGELGIDTYKAGTDRIEAGTGARNADLRSAEIALKAAREARQGLKDKASIRQADARIRISKENLKLQQQKARQEKKPGGSSDVRKAETQLGIDILQDRETILGKPGKYEGERVGAMTFEEAERYIRGLAESQMGAYRKPPYINNWVRQKLRVLFPTSAPGARRSGR